VISQIAAVELSGAVMQIDKLKFNMHTHDDDITGLYSESRNMNTS
jgi:hypothetical protein